MMGNFFLNHLLLGREKLIKQKIVNMIFLVRMTDQIIYVKDPPPLLREKFYPDSVALENLSSRLNSIRKTSIDVTSIISDGNELMKSFYGQ